MIRAIRALLVLAIAVGGQAVSRAESVEAPDEPAGGRVTYSRDIAPVIHDHCMTCHRPGEAAPFDLVTYEDLRIRAKQVEIVVSSRFMPPWLPEPGYGEFVGQRWLEPEEIERIRQWVADGAIEGDPADLPPAPRFAEGWQLGEPDLVVQMEQTYQVPSDGVDVFRNFVMPIPVTETRYVRAVEIRPGNPRVVHHGVLRTDRTLSSRRLDEQDEELGFGSMNMGNSEAPDGHILNWTPGMYPDEGTDDVAWRAEPGMDFVLQLHMLPIGKPEPVRPVIGLHFADRPPTRKLWELMLYAREIDIPAGVADHTLEDSYELPVGLLFRGIYPHAHYVGKKIHAWAELPDGSRRWMVRVDDWDFNWQDAYRYQEPIFLPAGTTLHARFVYDNSADNVRNPNFPPVRVRSGLSSTDEMGTVTFEVLPDGDEDLARLKESLSRQDLAKDPDDWLAHYNLATVLQERGLLDEAIEHYEATLRLNPSRVDAYNNMGLALHEQGRFDEAIRAYARAIENNPFYAHGHYNLANTLVETGRLEEAVQQYSVAIELRSSFADAHTNLGLALQRLGRVGEAVDHYEKSLQIRPEDGGVENNLANVLASAGRLEEAAAHYRRALELDPALADARSNLGNVFLMQGRIHDAIGHYRRALELIPDSEDVRYNLAEALQLQAELEQTIPLVEQEAVRTGYADVALLDELAQAYAMAGRYDQALDTIHKAIEVASARRSSDDVTRLRQRLRQLSTWRETSVP